MARTKGSGWGGGVLLYQLCPFCNKKKVIYDSIGALMSQFKCTSCRRLFDSVTLIKKKYLSQIHKRESE